MKVTETFSYGFTDTTHGFLFISGESTPTSVTYTASTWLETKVDSACGYTMNCKYDYNGTSGIRIVLGRVDPTQYFERAMQTDDLSLTVQKTSVPQTVVISCAYSGDVPAGTNPPPAGEESGSFSRRITVPALEEYTITYSAGSTSGVTNLPAAQTKIAQVDITLSDREPLRTGYNFAGWNTAEDGTGISYQVEGTYTADADVTLYAQWEPVTYRIVYLPNGSGVTNMPSDGVKTYGVNYVIPNIVPSRSGYYFLGWQSGSGTQYNPGNSITGNASFGLSAIWTNEAGYKPKITGSNGAEIPLVVRCQSDGTPDLFGEYSLVEFDWQTFASATGAAARLYYKLTSASTWTLAATISPLSGTSGSQSVVIGGGNLDISKSYNVRIVVEDSTGNTTRFNTTLTMSYMTLDFGGEGKAIGVGTEAPDPTGHANGLMQIAMDTIDANGDPFNGSDRVIGTVTSNGWTCTKWASGKLECEIVGSESVAFSASGTLYLGTITLNLPSIMVGTSSKSIQCESNTYFLYGGGYFTGTTSVTYNVFRAASGTRTLTYIAKVVGTWK